MLSIQLMFALFLFRAWKSYYSVINTWQNMLFISKCSFIVVAIHYSSQYMKNMFLIFKSTQIARTMLILPAKFLEK